MKITWQQVSEIGKSLMEDAMAAPMKPAPRSQTKPAQYSEETRIKYACRVNEPVHNYLSETAESHALTIPALLLGCANGGFKIRNTFSAVAAGPRKWVVHLNVTDDELNQIRQLINQHQPAIKEPIEFAVAVALGQVTLAPAPPYRSSIAEEEIHCALGTVLDFTDSWVLQSSVPVGPKCKWPSNYWTMRQSIDFSAYKAQLDSACCAAQKRLLTNGEQPHDGRLAAAIPNLLETFAADISIDLHYTCVAESERKLLVTINQIGVPEPPLTKHDS